MGNVARPLKLIAAIPMARGRFFMPEELVLAMLVPLGKSLTLVRRATTNRIGKTKIVATITGAINARFFMMGRMDVFMAMNIRKTAIVADMAGISGRYF